MSISYPSRMRFGVSSRGLALGGILALLAVFMPSTQATSSPQVTTCTNIENVHERISRTGDCRTGREFTSRWHLAASDSKIDLTTNRTVVLCSNKATSPVEYKVIRAKCAKHQISTEYFRSKVKPSQLVIETVTATGHDSAQIILKKPLRTDLDNPIAFYTVTPSTGLAQRVSSWKELSVTIKTLSALTSYTFTITATSVDGTSVASAASQKITTSAYVPPVSQSSSGNGSTLAAPAFTLSAIAETKTVNTSISGYTITSTGGTIASYAISPAAPAGTTFNTATGLLAGTPTATQSATAYTITATNASGSATRTFTLTVSAVIYTVGQTGPGGGKVFYAANTPFACGPSLNLMCSYLEVAPKNWGGMSEELIAGVRWSGNVNTLVPGGTSEAIGSGYQNSMSIVSQSSTAGRAATLARSYTGNSLTDWYLPSRNELTALKAYSVLGGAGTWTTEFPGHYFWTSSEINATTAWAMDFNDDSNDMENKDRDGAYRTRPIRAF